MKLEGSFKKSPCFITKTDNKEKKEWIEAKVASKAGNNRFNVFVGHIRKDFEVGSAIKNKVLICFWKNNNHQMEKKTIILMLLFFFSVWKKCLSSLINFWRNGWLRESRAFSAGVQDLFWTKYHFLLSSIKIRQRLVSWGHKSSVASRPFSYSLKTHGHIALFLQTKTLSPWLYYSSNLSFSNVILQTHTTLTNLWS